MRVAVLPAALCPRCSRSEVDTNEVREHIRAVFHRIRARGRPLLSKLAFAALRLPAAHRATIASALCMRPTLHRAQLVDIASPSREHY